MIERIREAIRPEGLDGWLFHNFRHRDSLSDGILGLDPTSVSTRRWLYAVPASGEPLKIVHAIEAGILDSLPGERQIYTGLEELKNLLRNRMKGAWATHWSESIPVISHLDAGTRELLSSCGIDCRSAETAIQRLRGLLDQGAEASHQEAARALYAIVDEAWAFIRASYASGHPLREGEVRDRILSAMAERGLVTDHPPIVAAGASSADPHYAVEGPGRLIRRGDLIQLDLWARMAKDDSFWADISWIGVFDDRAPDSMARRAQDLFAARDLALSFIRGRSSAGKAIRGSDVDEAVRAFLEGKGYGAALRHRTGHGIDRDCHGSGVNLDCVEFPDARFLLEGSCFSVEPGIYFDTYGMRTEIDVLMREGLPLVTGGSPQTALLTCQGG